MRSWSGRCNATSAAQVIRLRSRLESPERSQTSPNKTFSVKSINLGTTARMRSRGDDLDGGMAAIAGSFLMNDGDGAAPTRESPLPLCQQGHHQRLSKI